MNEEDVWMFFSLDQPMTKNQILNTKCQASFFCCNYNLKGEETAWSLLFSKCQYNTNFGWHLVFSILLLVISWPNEKNKRHETWRFLVDYEILHNLKWYKNYSFLQLEKNKFQKGHIEIIHSNTLRSHCLHRFLDGKKTSHF